MHCDRSVFVPELASASCGCGGCLTSLTLNINNLTGMSSFGQDRQSCMHACTPEMYAPVFVVVLVQKMLFCSHSDLTNVDCTCRRLGGGLLLVNGKRFVFRLFFPSKSLNFSLHAFFFHIRTYNLLTLQDIKKNFCVITHTK